MGFSVIFCNNSTPKTLGFIRLLEAISFLQNDIILKHMDQALKKIGIAKDLQFRLDNIEIPEEVRDAIANKEVAKTVLDAVLDFFQLGALSKVFNTAENIKGNLDEYKKGLLMEQYIGGLEDAQKEVGKLQKFVTDPEGNVIFSKMIRILNANPPNPGYARLLALTLKRIVESNFNELFEKHIYALNQIEQLTPQALALLADYANWPEYEIGNYSSNHGVITSDWIEEFLLYYLPLRNITDHETERRIAHAFKELLRNDFIRSRKQGESDSKDLGDMKDSDKKAVCEPTELGLEVLEYIDMDKK